MLSASDRKNKTNGRSGVANPRQQWVFRDGGIPIPPKNGIGRVGTHPSPKLNVAAIYPASREGLRAEVNGDATAPKSPKGDFGSGTRGDEKR